MRIIATLFLCSLVTGCTIEKSLSVVQVGMMPNHVIQIEGSPNEQAQQERYKIFVYYGKQQPAVLQPTTDRWFIFKDGHLLEYSTQYLNPSNDTNKPLRLTATEILSQWRNSQYLPVNLSARANE
ncbi:TPA: hypothetical protein ACS727_001130 [Providencia alcalifaciens]|uniref:hypothetical protein n=1 Tax=Providencia alcalifaciens TaxID=126385 RepID=UPI001CC38768|nr:hypothetical protein [Providencia alcalifaciens]CAG9425497.1 hypothetical protein NVI2019_NGLDDFDA_02518 [Providencia alcalifaciens]